MTSSSLACWPLLSGMHAALRLGAGVAIAALGAVVTWYLYNDTALSEMAFSKNAFRGSFASVLVAFRAFLVGQTRALCAVADALTTHQSLPSVQDIQTVRGGRGGGGFLPARGQCLNLSFGCVRPARCLCRWGACMRACSSPPWAAWRCWRA